MALFSGIPACCLTRSVLGPFFICLHTTIVPENVYEVNNSAVLPETRRANTRFAPTVRIRRQRLIRQRQELLHELRLLRALLAFQPLLE